VAYLREGLRLGYSAPRGNVERVIAQLDGLLALTAEDSPFYEPATRRSRVPAIVMAHDGLIWLTSYSAVVAFDGERIRRFSSGSALSSMAWRMGVDAGGDIWLGTHEGAYRILRRGFAHFTAEDGIPQEEVRRVMRGPDGHLYAVTEGSALARLDGRGWTAVRPLLPPFAGVTGRSRYEAERPTELRRPATQRARRRRIMADQERDLSRPDPQPAVLGNGRDAVQQPVGAANIVDASSSHQLPRLSPSSASALVLVATATSKQARAAALSRRASAWQPASSGASRRVAPVTIRSRAATSARAPC
jgi:hypothetical protein